MTRWTGERGDFLRVGVVGAGRMGIALANMAARAGHRVTIGSRLPERARRIASELAGRVPGEHDGGRYADAARGADAVILSCLWADVPQALAEAHVGPGTIVLDATNPEASDGRSLVLGHETSGGSGSLLHPPTPPVLAHTKGVLSLHRVIPHKPVDINAPRKPDRVLADEASDLGIIPSAAEVEELGVLVNHHRLEADRVLGPFGLVALGHSTDVVAELTGKLAERYLYSWPYPSGYLRAA